MDVDASRAVQVVEMSESRRYGGDFEGGRISRVRGFGGSGGGGFA